MRTYTADQLADILDKHAKWLRGEEGGARANLEGANLEGANLADANLARANLADANLARAYLAGADLAGADLAGANLARADLARAYLAGADLAYADLADANLAYASAAHNKYVITACLTNYQMALFQHKSTVLVTAGCRRGLTIEQAREHWSPPNQSKWSEPNEAYGKRQRVMLEFLVAQARELGWPVDAEVTGAA